MNTIQRGWIYTECDSSETIGLVGPSFLAGPRHAHCTQAGRCLRAALELDKAAAARCHLHFHSWPPLGCQLASSSATSKENIHTVVCF